MLNGLARHYASADPDRALRYTSEAMPLARRLGLAEPLALALGHRAYALAIQDDSEAALAHSDTCLVVAREARLVRPQVECFRVRGIVAAQRGDYAEAYRRFRSAVQAAGNDSSLAAVSLANAALTSLKMGNAEHAARDIKRVVPIFEREGRWADLASALNNLASAYISLEQPTRATQTYERVYELAERIGNGYIAGRAGANLGVSYRDAGEYDRAERVLRRAIAASNRVGDRSGVAAAHEELAETLVAAGRPAEALAPARRAIALADSTGSLLTSAEAYETTATILAALGRHAEAYRFLEQYVVLNDSVYDKDKTEALDRLQAEFDTERSEAEIDQLRAEQKVRALAVRQRTTLAAALALALALAVALAAALYARYRQRGRSETTLRRTVREREALLQEVHHRVKNNLQVVSSLLAMQGRRASPSVAAALRDLQGRVGSMALVHERLYRSDALDAVDAEAFVRDVAEAAHRSASQGEDVSLTVEAPDIELPTALAVPLGLAINELVSNAAEHAFPASHERPAQIHVGLTRDPQALVLTVTDNGRGLPDDALAVVNASGDKAPSAFATSTLGLTIVRAAADQLGGVLDAGSGDVAGTTYRLAFPPTTQS